MKKFKINVWYRYGRDHDETDFVPEEIEAKNELQALQIITENYKSKNIVPFKIELSK